MRWQVRRAKRYTIVVTARRNKWFLKCFMTCRYIFPKNLKKKKKTSETFLLWIITILFQTWYDVTSVFINEGEEEILTNQDLQHFFLKEICIQLAHCILCHADSIKCNWLGLFYLNYLVGYKLENRKIKGIEKFILNTYVGKRTSKNLLLN